LAGEVIDTVGGRAWTVIVALCVPLSADAVTVTPPLKLVWLVNANAAVADPLATVTVAGIENPALFDCKVTVFATDPAPAIVTVQFPDCPGEIEFGVHTRDTGPAVAVRLVDTDEIPTLAVKVTLDVPVNAPVLAVKLAVPAFAATVTLAGTLIMVEPVAASVTIAPPVGAAACSVTVHDVLALVASVLAPH
jgi:hypothetical protein